MDTKLPPETPYVLGHSSHELGRLSAQARLYDPFTEELFRESGVAEGMRVLDVGSGGGDVSFLIARIVGPSGQVVGVERAAAAVETAKRRATELRVPNVQFVEGDAATQTFEEPFDAVVGRFVLQFCPDPSAVLRQLVAQVRPGGIIAFQEVDWTGCRSFPELPTFSKCLRWGPAALLGSGADPYMGMKLATAFTSAGLPTPTLSVHAAIGTGPDHPLYSSVAGLLRTLLPAIEQLGIASAEELDVDTLAARLSAEVSAASGTMIWISLIGAAVRRPAE